MIRSTLAGIAALTLAALPVAAQAQPRAQSRAAGGAFAELEPLLDSGVTGAIRFEPAGEFVRIHGTVRGLARGKHGMHVHGGTSCEAPGDHYAPEGDPHGGPDAPQRHTGDLGNLAAGDDGSAGFDRIDRRVELAGDRSVLGHVLIVHAGEDDYLSQPSGDAGDKIACAVIRADAD